LICPLVEESESLDLAAAEARYEALRQAFATRSASSTAG